MQKLVKAIWNTLQHPCFFFSATYSKSSITKPFSKMRLVTFARLGRINAFRIFCYTAYLTPFFYYWFQPAI